MHAKHPLTVDSLLLWPAEYDYGERFDLKGPYCDTGYVDEDADFGKQVGCSAPSGDAMLRFALQPTQEARLAVELAGARCMALFLFSAAASRVLPNASSKRAACLKPRLHARQDKGGTMTGCVSRGKYQGVSV